MLQVTVVSLEGVLFRGPARSASFPGEAGTFEVLSLHRPIASRLVAGTVDIDGQGFPIRQGAVSVADDVVTAVVESR